MANRISRFRISRFELGMIYKMHDEKHYRCADSVYLAQQLNKIGLPSKVSRFELAERIKEIEREIKRY